MRNSVYARCSCTHLELQGVTLEDVALRRDEIAHFLVTRRDDPLPRPRDEKVPQDLTPFETPIAE